jgi:protein SCO1/2
MNMRPLALSLLLALLPAAGTVLAAEAGSVTLPGDSLYQLDLPLLDQDGHALHLRDLAGKPALVTMFYGNCKQVCPVVIEELKQLVAQVGPKNPQGFKVLLISLDPKHDTPAALTELMQMHKLDAALFRMATGSSEADTRRMAAVIGIKYRHLATGEINHSTHILLLDANGRQLFAADHVSGRPNDDMLKALNTALEAKTTP